MFAISTSLSRSTAHTYAYSAIHTSKESRSFFKSPFAMSTSVDTTTSDETMCTQTNKHASTKHTHTRLYQNLIIIMNH